MEDFILSSQARTWDELSSWMQERIIIELLNDSDTEPDDMYELGKYVPTLLLKYYRDAITASKFIELFMAEAKLYYRKYLDRVFDNILEELLKNGYIPKKPNPDSIDFIKGFF